MNIFSHISYVLLYFTRSKCSPSVQTANAKVSELKFSIARLMAPEPSAFRQYKEPVPPTPVALTQSPAPAPPAPSAPAPPPRHKTFACGDCGKVFNAHYNLTRHMPVHTGARPFVCKVILILKKHKLKTF